jgi:hypothetical protein
MDINTAMELSKIVPTNAMVRLIMNYNYSHEPEDILANLNKYYRCIKLNKPFEFDLDSKLHIGYKIIIRIESTQSFTCIHNYVVIRNNNSYNDIMELITPYLKPNHNYKYKFIMLSDQSYINNYKWIIMELL